MTQFSKGETFVDGQQVTGVRLNNLVDNSTALPGLITDQTDLTANTVALGDSVLLHDASASALREATASDLLNSNLPITTSSISAGTNSDIVVSPNDNAIVTGKAFTSGDGQTVTVTSTSHGLTVGQVILVTSATATDYNGTFQVATAATNSFTYVINPGVTAASGTLSYTKKGLVRNIANQSVAGNLYVDGAIDIKGSAKFSQSVLFSGPITSTGNSTLNGNITVGVGKTLTLDSAPTLTLHAATKGYVDAIDRIKAFAKVSGTTINSQLNIASVTNPSAGIYIFTFTNALADANYVISAIALNTASSQFCYVSAMSGSSFTIITGYPVSYGGAFLPGNVTSMMVSVMK